MQSDPVDDSAVPQFEPSNSNQGLSQSSRRTSSANVSCEDLKQELHRSRSRIKEFAEWPVNTVPVKTSKKTVGEVKFSIPQIVGKTSNRLNRTEVLQDIGEVNLFEEDSFKAFVVRPKSTEAKVADASKLKDTQNFTLSENKRQPCKNLVEPRRSLQDNPSVCEEVICCPIKEFKPQPEREMLVGKKQSHKNKFGKENQVTFREPCRLCNK